MTNRLKLFCVRGDTFHIKDSPDVLDLMLNQIFISFSS